MYTRLRYLRNGRHVLRKMLHRVFDVMLSNCRFFKGLKVKNEGKKNLTIDIIRVSKII